MIYFNPRSLTGATFVFALRTGTEGYFNPRSLTGATERRNSVPELLSISILAPSRERRTQFRLNQQSSKFQSSLPHGSDRQAQVAEKMSDISILAPSRERHYNISCSTLCIRISILAPSRERRNRVDIHHRTMNFNPRSLTGATTSWMNGITVDTNFNPRSLTGATQDKILNKLFKLEFQSSLPHGSDY